MESSRLETINTNQPGTAILDPTVAPGPAALHTEASNADAPVTSSPPARGPLSLWIQSLKTLGWPERPLALLVAPVDAGGDAMAPARWLTGALAGDQGAEALLIALRDASSDGAPDDEGPPPLPWPQWRGKDVELEPLLRPAPSGFPVLSVETDPGQQIGAAEVAVVLRGLQHRWNPVVLAAGNIPPERLWSFALAADATYLVVRAGVTTVGRLQSRWKELVARGARVAGVVALGREDACC